VPALRFASGEPGTGTDALRAPLSAALALGLGINLPIDYKGETEYIKNAKFFSIILFYRDI
jgi:hypothetical protein